MLQKSSTSATGGACELDEPKAQGQQLHQPQKSNMSVNDFAAVDSQLATIQEQLEQ